MLRVLLAVLILCSSRGADAVEVRRLPTPSADGRLPTIALGAGGLPLIAHIDLSLNDLALEVCGDAACQTSQRRTIDDSAQISTNWTIGTAITTSGEPLFAYPISGGSLLFRRCLDPDCQTLAARRVIAVDASGGTALFLTSDGLPRIFYTAQTPEGLRGLRLIVCKDADCQARSAFWLEAPTGVLVQRPVAVVGQDGLPRILFKGPANLLRFLRCLTASCESSVPVDLGLEATNSWDLTLDSSDKPVIAYSSGVVERVIKVVRCADEDCAGIQSPQEVPSRGLVSPLDLSVVLSSDDRPTLAVRDAFDGGDKVYVLRCRDPACAGADAIPISVDERVGVDIDMAKVSGARLVLAYFNDTHDDLEIASCLIEECPSREIFRDGFESQ